jgi:FAD/FMN-containing dehydrogenase
VGWLVRRCGLSADNLVAVEIATAEGRVRRVDAREDADLFWALRGAGIGFGAVTSLELALHPISTVVAGMVMHPAERALEVARRFRDLTAGAEESLSAILVFAVAPPAPFVPAALHGKPIVAIGACWCGTEGEGTPTLDALRAFGPPDVDTFTRMRYVDAQGMLDPTAPAHQLNYWKSAFLPALTDEAIGRIVARGTSLPSPLAQVHVHHLGGAVSRIPAGATAFGQRSAPYLVNVPTMWTEPERTDEMVAWTRACHAEIAGKGAPSTYLNFQDRDDHPEDVVESATRGRLQALKAAHDPDRLFGPEPAC